MGWRALLATGVLAVPAVGLGVGVPVASGKDGDSHITGQGDSTLIVVGTSNTVTALGTCWAVAVQGSSNIVIADHVVDDITVSGSDQTVLYHDGDPQILDRGRERGLTNRLDRVPA